MTNHATNAAERWKEAARHFRNERDLFRFKNNSLQAAIAATADITHSRDMYKQEFCKALDAVDAVFQIDSTKPPPLLPNFCKLGESKFEAVIRLAKAYIEKEATTAELVKERDELRAKEYPATFNAMSEALAERDRQAALADGLRKANQTLTLAWQEAEAATAELRAENEQLKSDLARIKSLCRTGKELNKERDALTVIAGYCEEDETTHPERGV